MQRILFVAFKQNAWVNTCDNLANTLRKQATKVIRSQIELTLGPESVLLQDISRLRMWIPVCEELNLLVKVHADVVLTKSAAILP